MDLRKSQARKNKGRARARLDQRRRKEVALRLSQNGRRSRRGGKLRVKKHSRFIPNAYASNTEGVFGTNEARHVDGALGRNPGRWHGRYPRRFGRATTLGASSPGNMARLGQANRNLAVPIFKQGRDNRPADTWLQNQIVLSARGRFNAGHPAPCARGEQKKQREGEFTPKPGSRSATGRAQCPKGEDLGHSAKNGHKKARKPPQPLVYAWSRTGQLIYGEK